MADIFAINNRFGDSGSLNRKNSNNSKASSQGRSNHFPYSIDIPSKFQRRKSEAQKFDPLRAPKDKSGLMNTLKIPEFSSAFPKTIQRSQFRKTGGRNSDKNLGNKRYF